MDSLPELLQEPETSVEEAFTRYWQSRASYCEIQELLSKYHEVQYSISGLKKLRKRLQLTARRGITSFTRGEIRTAINTILPRVPWTAGYRNITDTLRQMGFDVRRHMVMELMQEMDEDGILMRRRRKLVRRVYRSPGPNYCWHMDGYDKLKPFGFAIHGAIDGFSRRIMWLEVNPSNNNPNAVAYYYVRCVEQNKGCPELLTSDPGTETTVSAALQCYLRNNENSHRYVKSTANQRIEAWWCQMRRNRVEFWIQYFKALGDQLIFNKDDELDRLAIRYAFMPLLKAEMHDLANRWNNHYVSNSPRAVCPPGRPNILYALGENHLVPVTREDINDGLNQTVRQSRSGNEDFDEYAQQIYATQGFEDATTVDEAHAQFRFVITQAKS